MTALRGLTRPRPPAALLATGVEALDAPAFVPDPTVVAWLHATFIAEGGLLANPDHGHLRQARLGVLWTAAPYTHHMRDVWATAEIPQPTVGGWKRARFEAQLAGWFAADYGGLPLDFLITLYAPALAAADDVTFCAILEHELYHCGQARDPFGAPKFNRETGRPSYAMRGHDVEEFTPIVARYGARAARVEAMIQAGTKPPTVAAAAIAGACGTCHVRAA